MFWTLKRSFLNVPRRTVRIETVNERVTIITRAEDTIIARAETAAAADFQKKQKEKLFGTRKNRERALTISVQEIDFWPLIINNIFYILNLINKILKKTFYFYLKILIPLGRAA